jgi:general secretion pathway protein A
MYEAFYGLSSKPFQLNPDPSFYFSSKQHRRAKAYLDYGVMRNEGFIVITGEIGAGKTTIVRGLLDSLNRSNVVAGHLVSTQLDAEDTLRMVAAAFGVRAKDIPKSELLMTLEAFFIGQVSQGKRCLLVVDEAQNLTARAVEELRMLSNFQFGKQSLLQSFLVGQPEFRDILQRPEMEQFRQRVTATCHIGPLDTDETRQYIEHRLKCAGATDKPTFDDVVFEQVHQASRGIPRRINAICDRLLLLGFMGGKTHLSGEDVTEVVKEFAEESKSSGKRRTAGASVAYQAFSDPQAGADDVDIDLSGSPSLDEATAKDLELDVSAIGVALNAGRIERIEQSLARLEQTNLQTLGLIQKLVQAMTRSTGGQP